MHRPSFSRSPSQIAIICILDFGKSSHEKQKIVKIFGFVAFCSITQKVTLKGINIACVM